MKKILSIILFVSPGRALAHDEYVFDETLAHFWGSPLMVLALATLLGIVVGVSIFLWEKNKALAFQAGGGVGILFAVLFLVLAGPHTTPTTPLESVDQKLAGVVATVYKSPNCGCCSGYIEELKRQGANVTVETVDDARLTEVKTQHGVTPDLSSCHTSIIGDYVVEGHVPIEAVVKLLAERPGVRGIALPGMPSGTPGMPGPKFSPYEVRSLDGNLFMKI